MIKIKNYKKVENLEEAWELNQKRTNRIIGGMLWVKICPHFRLQVYDKK